MNKLLILSASLIAILFTGCAIENPQVRKKENAITTFTNLDGSETLFKSTFIKKGKHNSTLHYFFVTNIIKNIKTEVKDRGYKYFQIVYPESISNLNGFPINKKKDLAGYIAPAMTNNTSKTGFLESKKTLMDNQNQQNVIEVPMTIFGDTKIELIVRLVKEPMEDEIVWDATRRD